jgi:hypothetical protein
MSKSKIAGKYLEALDPSVEIRNAKTQVSPGSLRPSYISTLSNPEFLMQSKNPEVAFNAAGLGFGL